MPVGESALQSSVEPDLIIERDINIVLFAFLPGGSEPFLEVLQYRAGNVCANLCHTWCNKCTHF